MQPLAGMLVLDFSTLLPGPLATLMLAEAGAEVVKIETPTGDAMRDYSPKVGPDSAVFAILNRGKSSIAVDLKQEARLRQVLDLVRRADVLVEQFRPGVMSRLGLGYEALAAINPRLIYCSITGYGQTGPRAAQAGHDLNFAAETGLLALSLGGVERAVLPGTPIGDIGGGAYPALINILLALEERRHTGRGRHLDIAMCENVFPFLYWALANGFASGRWPEDGDSLVTGATPRYHVYPTRDGGGLVVAALEPKFWAEFCDVVGLGEDLRDDRVNANATLREVARLVALEDAEAWAARLDGRDCCCSILTGLQDAVADVHFAARGVFSARVEAEGGGELPALPMPLDRAFRAAPAGTLRSPALGADTDRLLGDGR